jgi:uncharacterized protein (UPF0335 family)
MPKINEAVTEAGLVSDKKQSSMSEKLREPGAPLAEPTAGHNSGVDWKAATQYVERMEAVMERKASIMGTAMAECKALSEDIGEILDEAKNKGVPKKAVRAVVRARALEEKANEARNALEAEQMDAFDNLRLALGDLSELPLGQHALQGAATLDSLTH